MRSARSWVARATLAVVVWAASLALAQAAPLAFTVPLTGQQQVPPVTTAGTGSAKLNFDPATRVLTWTVTSSGLSGAATMAHFHGPAPEGKNASPVIWISKKGSPATGELTGQATLTPEQAQQFLAGDWYINVHTPDHPAGEIRGQVVPPKS